MTDLNAEMSEWLVELAKAQKLTKARAQEIWELFLEESNDASEPHAWDLAEQEIKFALNEKEEPLKSKLELYDKIRVPFSGGFPIGDDADFGTSME
jgi:hypothetical protein